MAETALPGLVNDFIIKIDIRNDRKLTVCYINY